MDPAGLAAHTGRYLELAAVALAVGIALGIPLGIAAALVRAARTPVLLLANAGRVIPSLALLTFMIPLLGFGFAPALAALSVLALAPVAITTDVAMRAISPAVLDAARGMGMNASQMFVRVQWPLALPLIFSGIRTATTEVIASAVLASFIGAGGLGDDIQSGLQADEPGRLWSAVVLIAIVALLAEWGLSQIVRRGGAQRA
ncbi:MAG TPA: ABC transporter permease [Candidatus Baltobacteraceae bacterium]|jgi:osmoprotectant transport system permease protein|nr:ABC transporter permease [Candidatus Baltobacteraceae bacterium]